MSERIAIKHGASTWHTLGTLEGVCEALNAGEAITVFGFNQQGRWEERIIFYGQPEFVITDKD